jgi:phosphatidylglycerol---prolipoprotein diacylglyceryl transferase
VWYHAATLLEPAIPYITLPEVPIFPAVGDFGPLTIKPFGTLVATGVYLGWNLAAKQAKRLGLDAEAFNSFCAWIVTAGFIGGHVFDVILYHPKKVTDVPFFEAVKHLAFIWESQASFGGFMGAIIGLVAWKLRYKKESTLAYADTVASAFPFAWVFGRMGCSVAHDHPGAHSDAWYAIQYPDGGRYDLGLYEMLFTVLIASSFFYFMRKPRPYGFYLGVSTLVYAPVRFGLDFLRARDVRDADPRHFGLTPAQWLCVGMAAVGVSFLLKAVRAAQNGETPEYVEGTLAPAGAPVPVEEPLEDPADGAEDDEASAKKSSSKKSKKNKKKNKSKALDEGRGDVSEEEEPTDA